MSRGIPIGWNCISYRESPPIKEKKGQTYLERLANTLAEIEPDKTAQVASLLNSNRDRQVFVLGNGGS